MKTTSLLTAALITLGLVSQASADNVLYVTGSTAFRATAEAALAASSGGVFDAGTATFVAERGGTKASNGNYMLFHGNISGTPTYINCAWSGSQAGLASVANVTSIPNPGPLGNIPLVGVPETWLKVTATGLTTSDPTTADLETSSRQGDVAFTDTSDADALSIISSAPGADLIPIGSQGGQVAIQPFVWVKNKQGSAANAAKTAWTDFTNISEWQAQNLLGAGFQYADYFTGKPADDNTTVYLVGRNKGSGTRANYLADTQYGLETGVNQFSIGTTANLNILTSQPVGTDLTLTSIGNSGYESGGNVAVALEVIGASGSCGAIDTISASGANKNAGNTGWFAVGFLGLSDANSVGTATSGQWLTLDGVPESDGAVTSGTYSAWGYENLYGKDTLVSPQSDIALALWTGVYNNVNSTALTGNSTAIPLADMNCSKATDFSTPGHN